MTDKTNVIPFFWNTKKSQKNIQDISDTISDGVSAIHEKKNLKLHESFTRQNVLWAIISNRFINVDTAIKESLLSRDDHDYKEMMLVLRQYVKNSLDWYYFQRWCEVQWWWSSLNSLLLIEKWGNCIFDKFTVELWVNQDMTTDILIRDEVGEIVAMISENRLAIW